MTNLDLIKEKLNKMTAEEIAPFINNVYCEDETACDYCAYDNNTCSGEDCEHGIKVYLKQEVAK